MVSFLPGNVGRRSVDGTSWVWRQFDKRESKVSARKHKEHSKHTRILPREKQEKRLKDSQETSSIARFCDFVIRRQDEARSSDQYSRRIKVQANPKVVEVVLRSVPTLLDLDAKSCNVPPIDREYQVSSSYTDGVQENERPQERSSIETVLNTGVINVKQSGTGGTDDKMSLQELLNAVSEKKNRIAYITRFLRGRDGRSVDKRAIGTQTSLLPRTPPEGCSISSVSQSMQGVNTLEAVNLRNSEEKECSVEETKCFEPSVIKQESAHEGPWSTSLENGVNINTKGCNYLESFIPLCAVSMCGGSDRPMGGSGVAPNEDEIQAATSHGVLLHLGTEDRQPDVLPNSAAPPLSDVVTDAPLQDYVPRISIAQPGSASVFPLFGNFVAFSNKSLPTLLQSGSGDAVKKTTGSTEEDCRDAGNSKVRDTSDEDARQSPGCDDEMSNVRIIPLFGFLSSVIGQCYIVSLSTKDEIRIQRVPGQVSTSHEGDKIAGRFWEKMFRDKPEVVGEQEMEKDRDTGSHSQVNKQNENEVKSVDLNGNSETPDISSLPVIGVLRRVGDEYVVDPLYSSTYHEFEVDLSQFYGAAIDGLKNHSDATSWETKAAALTLDAKEKISTLIHYLGKLGGSTPHPSEAKVMVPEIETTIEVDHNSVEAHRRRTIDRASKSDTGSLLEVVSSLDSVSTNQRKCLYSTFGFSI